MLKKKNDRKTSRNNILPEDVRLFRYALTDSTNLRAREYALEGNAHTPALFWADAQSNGSGRLGRSFFSPDGSGIYLTLLVREVKNEKNFALLTSLAAVCALEAIETVFGVSVDIKWVNDLYFNQKKVAGILAQSFAGNGEKYVCLGIGLNVCTSEFPEDIKDKAGSILDELVTTDLEAKKEGFVLEFFARTIAALESEDTSEYMKKYRSRSCVIGKNVRFVKNGETFFGFAEDINDMGALKVRLTDGGYELLLSGEISLSIDRDKTI